MIHQEIRQIWVLLHCCRCCYAATHQKDFLCSAVSDAFGKQLFRDGLEDDPLRGI